MNTEVYKKTIPPPPNSPLNLILFNSTILSSGNSSLEAEALEREHG